MSSPSASPAPSNSPLARIQEWVTRDTSAGILLITAAAFALIWANSPLRGGYQALSEAVIGPAALGLDLSLAAWAADGLLAVFFFTVGLELKHEFVDGSLRSPKQAAMPMIAAVGGMIVPAIIFIAVVLTLGANEATNGWAIPVATDIAFAVGVLALFGKGLPRGIRMFLLTLAVVDDLLAIIVIAIFYSEGISPLMLGLAFVFVALFALVARSRKPHWAAMLPFALLAWGFMHASGVHATIAGVLLGFMVPAVLVHGETETRTHRYNEALAPLSNGLVLPIFAFFSAGVNMVDGAGPGAVLGQPVVYAIMLGLVVGKFVGVLGTTALFTTVTPLTLPDGLKLKDMLPVGFLTGIGFTVSLLIAELSFPAGTLMADGARMGVLLGTLVAAILAAVSLKAMSRKLARTGAPASDVVDGSVNRVSDDPQPGNQH